MTSGLRALWIGVLLCGCAHEPKQLVETTLQPFSATGCEHFREDRRFRAHFRASEPEKVFQVVADVTCFTFVVDPGIRARLTLESAQFSGVELFSAVTAGFEKQGVAVTEVAPRRYRVSARQ